MFKIYIINLNMNRQELPPIPPINDDLIIITRYDHPIRPDFSFIQSISERNMIQTAYEQITSLEQWKLLENFNEESFMSSQNDDIKKIMGKVNDSYNGHSAASLGITMRHIEYIAKNGFDMYRNNHNP